MKRLLIVIAIVVACLAYAAPAMASIKYSQFTYNGVTVYSAVNWYDSTSPTWRDIYPWIKLKTSDRTRTIDCLWWGREDYFGVWSIVALDQQIGTTWTVVNLFPANGFFTLRGGSAMKARFGSNPYTNFFSGW